MSGNSLQDKCVKCDWPAGEEEKEVERWSKDCWIVDRDKKMQLEKTKDLTGQQEARRKPEHCRRVMKAQWSTGRKRRGERRSKSRLYYFIYYFALFLHIWFALLLFIWE